MKPKNPDDKTVGEPKNAKELAQAMFLLADRKLPPGKRTFTKGLRKGATRGPGDVS